MLEVLDRLGEGVAVVAHQGPDVGQRSRDREDAGVEIGAVPCRSHGGLGQVGVPHLGRDASELDLVGDVGQEPRQHIKT